MPRKNKTNGADQHPKSSKHKKPHKRKIVRWFWNREFSYRRFTTVKQARQAQHLDINFEDKKVGTIWAIAPLLED